MLHDPLRSAARAAAFLLTFVLLSVPIALAQGAAAPAHKPGEIGRFDFYVLALSWSPSFCQKERAARRARDPQCSGRPFSFVVHGLWPQFERGYPSYCQVPAPRLERSLVDSALDLMPSRGLIYHEWNRHGTCTGLTPQVYFAAVRKARAAVTIPPQYRDLGQAMTATPAAVTDAFVKANPGLSRADVAVACDRKRLTEVRLCLSREFAFRPCPQVVRRACRRDSIVLPAVRGARGG
jgi:ribonuclease T2